MGKKAKPNPVNALAVLVALGLCRHSWGDRWAMHHPRTVIEQDKVERSKIKMIKIDLVILMVVLVTLWL